MIKLDHVFFPTSLSKSKLNACVLYSGLRLNAVKRKPKKPKKPNQSTYFNQSQQT